MAIEIVDFPVKNKVIFHSKILVHQRVEFDEPLALPFPIGSMVLVCAGIYANMTGVYQW